MRSLEFILSDVEDATLVKWLNDHEKDASCIFSVNHPNRSFGGAIGGTQTFSFTGTSLGTIKTVKCACGAQCDYTEYEAW